MDAELLPGPVKDLVPEGTALAAHCQRVAGLALEIARKTRLPRADKLLLRQAALLHHCPPLLLDSGALRRLLSDVLAPGATPRGLETAAERPAPESAIHSDLAVVLRILNCRFHGPVDSRLRRVAAILQLSDLLDEQMQLQAYEDCAPAGMWAGLERISEFTLFDRNLLQDAERALTGDRNTLSWPGPNLSVEAGIARRVFTALACHREWEIRELETLAASDPVLAGRLIQVANSALYSPMSRVASVRQAIAYIGGDQARKVMLAVALEPVFRGAGLHRIWKHSLRAAQFGEALAQTTGIMSPDEALLLGLIHDIGRQATQSLLSDLQATSGRLQSAGCPLTYVERLFFGRDHGEIGAEVLRDWNFPEHLTLAVRDHHRPEAADTVHAAMVYLIEFWTGDEEDLPSLTRLGAALARTGVSGETLMELAPRRGSFFERLAGE